MSNKHTGASVVFLFKDDLSLIIINTLSILVKIFCSHAIEY